MAEAQSQTVIEALMGALDQYDFGIFILSKDDVLTIRGEESAAPRDNVILELGLFTGRLGRERTFIVGPKDLELRRPTDLLGVNLGTYTSEANPTSAVRTSARRARERIIEIGPRPKEAETRMSAAGEALASKFDEEWSTAGGGRLRARPAEPGDGWVEAARSGLLVPFKDAHVEPGDWVASAQTGLARIIEILPPVASSSMLVHLAVDGVDGPVFLAEDRLFLPHFRSHDKR
jgi:hypothetical protein